MVLGGQLSGRVDGRRNSISFNVKSVMVGMAQLVSAPDCGSGGRGFESHYPPFLYGSLAQSVEHWTFNPGVPGSSPG